MAQAYLSAATALRPKAILAMLHGGALPHLRSWHLKPLHNRWGIICSHQMSNAGTAQVNVAQQIYDLVDQRILQLDRNLQSFDTELIRQRHKLDLPVSSCLQTSLCLPGFV